MMENDKKSSVFASTSDIIFVISVFYEIFCLFTFIIKSEEEKTRHIQNLAIDKKSTKNFVKIIILRGN